MTTDADIRECASRSIVAVVDDDRSTRTAIANLLEAYAVDVVVFASSEELLAFDALPSIACLVSDVQLPGIDGLALVRALVDRGVDLPVIFVTAYPDLDVHERARSLGARGFFGKPFDGGALMRSVKDAIAA